MKIKILSQILLITPFLLFVNQLFSQSPTHQDCLGAIPVCKSFYSEPDPYNYSGDGNYLNEIGNETSCAPVESNGIWYTFSPQNSGLLRFVITPHKKKNDYDWIVFDMTDGNCSDLEKNSGKFRVSSNTYGYSSNGSDTANITYLGVTGMFTDSIGTDTLLGDNCNGPGDTGSPFNKDLLVQKNRIYVLYISNYDKSRFGYDIDFSASTASIFDNNGPKLETLIQKPKCNDTKINFNFNENVLCSSVSTSSCSFNSSGNTYKILKIESADCSTGAAMSRSFSLTLDQTLQPGTYALQINDKVNDACLNPSEVGENSFTLENIAFSRQDYTDVLCFGEKTGSITLQGTGNSTFKFSIDSGKTYTSTSGIFTNLSAGQYFPKLKDENNCESSGNKIEIQQPEKLQITDIQSKNIENCYNDSTGELQITATGGKGEYSYSIDGGNNFEKQTYFTNLQAGNYRILVKDENDCKTDVATQNLSQPDQLQITDYQLVNVTDCDGIQNGAIQITAQGGTPEYEYSLNNFPFQKENLFTNLGAGIYSVTIKDSKQCETTTKCELIDDLRKCLGIPEAFSPNGDGINDTWVIKSINKFPNAEIFIFNRWGILLKKFTPNDFPWNGTVDGTILPLDSYYFVIKYNINNFSEQKGRLTIIR